MSEIEIIFKTSTFTSVTLSGNKFWQITMIFSEFNSSFDIVLQMRHNLMTFSNYVPSIKTTVNNY